MHARIRTRLRTLLPLLLLASAPAFAQPKIQISGGESIDWGYAIPGILKHDITVVNRGTDTLELLGIASGSSSVGDVDNNLIAPGDSVRITVKMETLRTVGERKGWLKIQSNDPERQFVTIPLRAYALRHMFVEPDGAILFPGESVVGKEVSTSITMVNMSLEPITLLPNPEIQGCDAVMRVDIPSPVKIPAGGKTTFKIFMTPLTPGHGDCFIEFHAKEPNVPSAKTQLLFDAVAK